MPMRRVCLTNTAVHRRSRTTLPTHRPGVTQPDILAQTVDWPTDFEQQIVE